MNRVDEAEHYREMFSDRWIKLNFVQKKPKTAKGAQKTKKIGNGDWMKSHKT